MPDNATPLGWVPKDHPLYGTPGYVGSQPAPGQPASVSWTDYQGPEVQVQENPPLQAAPKPMGPVNGDPGGLPAVPQPAADMTPQQAAAAGLGWVDKNHPLYGTPGYVGSTPATAGAQPGAAPGQPAPAVPGQGANVPIGTQPPATINDAFRQALMTQLNTNPNQVDRSVIDPQVAAYRTGQQRSQERAQNQLAEQAALEGTSTSGGALADKLGLEQGRGLNESTFESQLVGQQLMQQRQQLMQAIQLAQQYGTSQDQLALQDKLAAMDAAIREKGLDVQSSLGQGDLALRGQLGRGQLQLGQGQLNLGLLNSLIGQQQGNDQLGFNYTALQNSANRDAILALLGGG